MPETNARIKVCHDTAANFKTNNPTLLVGEWALETDTKRMKIGDGSTAYNALPYSTAEDSDEWRKPDDWIDIRSGALPNSVYFLVGHSADYSTYPTFEVFAQVSNSGTYDIYVDGIKQVTTSHNATTTMNWQTLALTSGYDVTYPSALRTHIVRVTPTVSTDTITLLRIGGINSISTKFGLLWAHFTLNNKVSFAYCFGYESGSYTKCPILEAITSETDEIKGSSLYAFAANCTNLKTLPKITLDSTELIAYRAFGNCGIQNICIENAFIKEGSDAYLSNCQNLKKAKFINCKTKTMGGFFSSCTLLEKLPALTLDSSITNASHFLYKNTHLQNTILDLSMLNLLKTLGINGTSTNRILGLKGLTVSPEAPFDSTTAPQIDVSYTGMERPALIGLFKSMPYNVGYTVVGSPTIVDGVASGFSANNRIEINSFPATAPWKIVIPYKYAGGTGTQNILGNADTFIIKTYNSGLYLSLKESGSTGWDINESAGLSLTNGAWTYISLEFTGTMYKYSYSTDGVSFTLLKQYTLGNVVSNKKILFGAFSSSVATGSIDLNETYIKVNGVPWFTGKAAMTKTCSIVGCTGTADLTADDKSIAEDKGWELVLS